MIRAMSLPALTAFRSGRSAPLPSASMPLYLVRHAKAGNRHHWTGDDVERPLSPKGQAQADGLAKALDGVPLTRVLSSPYVRCVQTVEPLAAAHGLEVEETPALAEGRPLAPVLELLHDLP